MHLPFMVVVFLQEVCQVFPDNKKFQSLHNFNYVS